METQQVHKSYSNKIVLKDSLFGKRCTWDYWLVSKLHETKGNSKWKYNHNSSFSFDVKFLLNKYFELSVFLF